MNDTMQKHAPPARGGLTNGSILAALIFCLAYGSVMALVIAPRSLLTAGTGEGTPPLTSNSLTVPAAGQAGPQLLKAGFFTARPAEASVYGITD